MLVRTVVQNLKDGGQDRWDQLAKRINAVRPDLVLLNEALDWAEGEPPMLSRAAHDLGLAPLPLPPSRTGYHVAIFYKPATIGDPADVCDDFSAEMCHGVLSAAWDVGLPEPLGVTVTHLSPFSTIDAVRDAQKTGYTASRYGRYSVIGGGFSYPPLYGPDPDLARMSTLSLARQFKDPLASPPVIRNTDVAQSLANDGYHDSFEILHRRTGNARYIARTGRSDRTDWTLVSGALVPAVADGELLDTPEGACEYRGLALTLDTSRADQQGTTAPGPYSQSRLRKTI